MTPSQFQVFMRAVDRIERRLGRVEIQVGAIIGGLVVVGILLQAGVLNVGG